MDLLLLPLSKTVHLIGLLRSEQSSPLIQAMANSLDINATDGNNNTALDLALKNKEIADLLRKHGGKTGEELKAEGK